MGSFSRSTKGSIVRKLLVFVQFMLGASFIAAVYVINLQVEHMRQDNDGFSVEKVVVVKLRGISNEQKNKTFHLFEEKLNSLPEIESVSGSFTYPGDKNFGEQALSKNKADLMRIMFDINVVSSEYFTTLSHNLVAGAYFADQVGANSEDCILNELAVEELGYSNPLEAIGQTVYFNRLEREFTIIGVIQNYYRNTKKVRLVPEIFFTEFTEIGPNIKLGNILIKITGDEKDFMTTLGKIEKTWQEVNPDKAFDYRLVDQVFERILYQENQFKSVFAFFTLMGVFVCCLGLFGLSSYNTTSRIKEIGIRKTMGGSIGGIVWLFSRDYLKLILASSAIGLPIGIYFLNEWLKNYPSRVSIGVDALLIPLIIIITISALTVGYQTYHSAQMNPINSLRNE